MDKPFKFVLPSPNFNKSTKNEGKSSPHYLTPSGMSLLPREKQPPPMYGTHGTTLPARYLKHNAEQTKLSSLPSAPEKHYCEPCEMELQSLDDLKRHRVQHEKCPVAGCLYKSHPSVMDKHVSSLHTSGLFDKFKKLSTPEEIAAWREERRKRYPTLANVLLKQKAREQRQKRGERLEENKNRFGMVHDKKRAQLNVKEKNGSLEDKKLMDENKKIFKSNKKRKNKSKSKHLETKHKVQVVEKKELEVVSDDTALNCGGVAVFKGTSKLKNYKHFNPNNKAPTINALFGLVGMYGSDDDESICSDRYNEDEGENIVFIKGDDSISQNPDINHTQLLSVNSSTKYAQESKSLSLSVTNASTNTEQESRTLELSLIEKTWNDVAKEVSTDDDAPEEAPIQRCVDVSPLQPQQEPLSPAFNDLRNKCFVRTQKIDTSRLKQSKKSGLDYRKARLRKQNTLLEKLLQSDIRHERNVLLQCIRFVCENHFFNISNNLNEK